MVFHPKKHDCEIRDFLKTMGLQRSKDRQSMLALFQEHRTWTAQELIDQLPETSRATIYNNINLFVEKGIVVTVHHHDQTPHYELAKRGHHDHVLCKQCKVTECVDCVAPDLPAHTLELNGLCTSCQ